MHALAMVGQDFDYAALIDPAMGAADDHSLKFGPKSCQAVDALIDFYQPGAGDLIGSIT